MSHINSSKFCYQEIPQSHIIPGPEVLKLFFLINSTKSEHEFYSANNVKMSTIFILLKNVKMPTTVGILTFISRINTSPERLKAI